MDRKKALPLLEEVMEIRASVEQEGDWLFKEWDSTPIREGYRNSARNLAYYMAFRRKDMRELQEKLIPWGVSSLGRLEADVLGTLNAVTRTLGYIADEDVGEADYRSSDSFLDRNLALRRNADDIFGPPRNGRDTRILVTMPSAAGSDYELVKTLVESGMNMARINCAHDDADTWSGMIGNIRKAEGETGLECRVLMDISGPKIRTRHLLTSMRNPKLKVGERFLLSGAESMTLPKKVEIALNTSVPEVIGKITPGQKIKMDDGHIEAEAVEQTDDGIICEVERTVKEGGVKVKTEKGINLPDLDFKLPVLTEKDYRDLDFAVQHADAIAFSFIKDVEDIDLIEDALSERLPEDRKGIPSIAKIETPEGIRNLPDIIQRAAGSRPFGVMLARGDLAVEIGYERLSEIQEELLWICEAAHVPVIWATQVVESLVKTGIPTRSEISDVVAGSRAECIMLNKGEYIADGVGVVSEILEKFEDHHYKKTSMLRALGIANHTFDNRG
ncbi:pyruvate kinase [Salinicoccus roseus]|uniref:pyruvate kinase n=1 Tax=Salinicoccus roseus TaxID=45670 RepID=UPI000F4F413D|nr:pyruvate kinase [Salinicoccus roseus]RPE51946.1 pyruvate kinase [Salinicoccus roseus]GGA74796.1 pyruvate kinase [Salinicoccus roseus]